MSEVKDRLHAVRLKRIRTHLDLAERAAQIGHWRYDLTDSAYAWSPGMYRLLGENPDTRKPDAEWLFEQITPQSRIVIETALTEAIRTRSPFTYRTYARDPKRAVQIVDSHGEVEIDEDGRVVAVLGVSHDVTAQVRAEAEREKAQAMYRLMTEESGDIVILYATDGRLLFVSSALERITGRTADEIRDGGYKRFIHPDDAGEADKMVARPVDGDITIATWRILHRGGHYVWLETTIRTVFDPATGEPRNVISVSRDVSARVEAEEARRKADEMYRVMTTEASDVILLFGPDRKILFASDALGRVMGRTVGEIENGGWLRFVHPDDLEPLRKLDLPPRRRETMTVGYRLQHSDGHYVWLEVVTRARYAPDGTYLGYISVARDISERKEREIEAGKMELNFEHVDLGETIADVVRLLDDRAHAAGVTLEVGAPTKTALIADRRAVKQVAINLISNAIKFTPRGGAVTVHAATDGEMARVTVSDTGIGIPASEIGRLGRPFEQVCADPKLAKTGTGLGLALVRALTEKHGGGMAIASEEGVGTEVTATFALKPAERAAA